MWFELASENAKGEELHALFRSRYEAAIAEVSAGEREKVTALVANWNARNVRTLAQAAPQQ
jgi:hypothetical protein